VFTAVCRVINLDFSICPKAALELTSTFHFNCRRLPKAQLLACRSKAPPQAGGEQWTSAW
jgi:hypothetical protein